MSGDSDDYGYLVGYVYPKTKKRLFGFGKEKMVNWVEIYLTQEKEQVKHFFKLYFDKNYDQLHHELKKLEMFGKMEAPN